MGITYVKKVAIVFVLTILLVGCGANLNSSTDTEIRPSTPNPPTAISTLIPIKTKRPSITPIRSKTPPPWPTVDLSQRSMNKTMEFESKKTQAARATDFAQYSIFEGCGPYLLSPDENWLACSHDYMDDNSGLFVGNKITGKAVDYQSRKIFEADELSHTTLRPRYFSSDSHYLYITSIIPFDGGGPYCFYGYGGMALLRLELETGEIVVVVPSGDRGYELFVEFSKSGRRLAYTNQENTLNILDLKTGEKNEYVFSEHVIGDFRWSLDEKMLAFTTDADDMDAVNSANIRLLDIHSGLLETIYHSESECLYIREWSPINEIVINKQEGMWNPLMIMKYHFLDGSISLETPTPEGKH